MIDTPYSTLGKAAAILAAGHSAVIRYLSPNTVQFPNKRLKKAELAELSTNGIWCGGVYEKLGDLDSMTAANGTRDAQDAVSVLKGLGVPTGINVQIYFASDFPANADQAKGPCADYFKAAQQVCKGEGYLSSGYGDGVLLDFLFNAGVIHSRWLAGAYGWPGSRDSLAAHRWDILQEPQPAVVVGLDVDLDIIESAAKLPTLGFFKI